MDKILVEVYLPSIKETYDIFIPKSLKIYELTSILSKTLMDITSGTCKLENSILCDRNTGSPYDINITISELDLNNGSKLLLI